MARRTERSQPLPLPPTRLRRVAFAGTPDDAVPTLRALAESGFDIGVVVTGAPRRRSRRGSDTLSPVAAAAAELGLIVSHDVRDLAAVAADCAVVVAYGHILGADLLAETPMLNLHFSLLPRWRGAAPVERALLEGDETTGVCLMALEPTLDTGPVYWRHEIPIGPTDTADLLRRRLAHDGAQRLAASLRDGLGDPAPQQGTPTYARKITQSDREIDWTRPASHIDRQIRAGGAWTLLGDQRLIIRQATPLPLSSVAPESSTRAGEITGDAVVTASGLLRLEIVQPSGRLPLPAQDWLNGARLAPGTRLGTVEPRIA